MRTRQKLSILLLLLICTAGGATYWARHLPTTGAGATASPPAAQPRDVPHLASSGVVEAAEIHAQLLAAAQNMPEPTLASVTNHASAPSQAPVPMPEAPLPPVPENQQLAIGFSSNVVGEVDPCG